MKKRSILFLLLAAGGIMFFYIQKKVIEKMALAIQDWEDGVRDYQETPGTRAARNNNPGNLKYAGQPGAIDEDAQGHAIFDTYQDGWNALIRQLRIAFLGLSRVYKPTDTLYAFFGKYAEANSDNYAEFVAARLGVSPDRTLLSLGA